MVGNFLFKAGQKTLVNAGIIFMAIFCLSACKNGGCVESEYVNCSVNKENFAKIRIGMKLEELYQVLQNKNALKSPALGQGSVLKEWDKSIMWTRCSLFCEEEKEKPIIFVKLKNNLIVSKEFSED